jgi:hypothetical protein
LLSALTKLGLVRDANRLGAQAGGGDHANDAGGTDRQSGQGASFRGCRHGRDLEAVV